MNPKPNAAPEGANAEAPAEASAAESRPLFTKPGEEAEPAAKPEAEAEKPAEAKPEEPAAAAEPESERQEEERAAAVRARLARERAELEVQRAEIEKANKELADARAKVAKLERYKEDPILLLEEMGHTDFSKVSKAALSKRPTDPLALELKADLQGAKGEVQKLREEIQQREFQKAVAEEQGKISAELEKDDMKLVRAAGWTPEQVWHEMATVFQKTQKLPPRAEVMKLIKSRELERRKAILDDAIAAGEVVRPAPKADPKAKAKEPAKTINSQRSEPPAKSPKKLTIEEKLANALRERPMFEKE